MEEFGVVYYTDGNPHFQKMLDASVASLRRFHAGWPVKVFTVPTPKLSLLRKVYRMLTPGKNVKRRERCGQDTRTIARKADIVLETPFTHTLYLDVDTIIMQSLDQIRQWVSHYDLIITPLPWAEYKRVAEWQPDTWPRVMAGVFAYNERFRLAYERMVVKFGGSEGIARIYNTDQYVLSLLCRLSKDELMIKYWPDFQIDTVCIDKHLGTSDYPKIDGKIDIRSPLLKRFRIFHYNEYKTAYMQQIRTYWGYNL